MFVWLDTQIYSADAAHVSALSTAQLTGLGVFTTIGIQHSRPLWLSRHCARLRRDGALLNLICAHDDATIARACETIIAANKIENGIARLTLCGSGDNRWRKNSGASLLICAQESTAASDEIRLWLAPHQFSAQRPLCGVKTTSYAPWQWLWQQAQTRGCQEAIYCESEGHLCEGARSNLFWIHEGEIYTPALSCGPLPGIGRAVLIEIARRENFSVREVACSRQTLRAADEIFITNAVSGPRRVISVIDDAGEIFRARESTLVRQLQTFWRAAREAESA